MPKITVDSRSIDLNKFILFVIILILLIGNIFWGIKYSSLQKELKEAEKIFETQKVNEDVLNFAQLFINKVLKAEEEVSFEDRLELENTVRNLKDQEILEQWEKFTASTNEDEAQKEVKDLLTLLVSKIKVK